MRTRGGLRLVNAVAVAVLLFTLLVPAVFASDSINLKLPTIVLNSPNQSVMLEAQSNADIVLAVVSNDPNLIINSQKEVGSSTNLTALIQLANATSGTYSCSIAFTSPQKLSVVLEVNSTDSTTILQSMDLPGVMTTQLDLQIQYGQASVQYSSLTAAYSPQFELWSVLTYVVVIPVFLATAYLDNGSLSQIRKRWKPLDSFALVLRYAMYALVIIFAIITVGIFTQITLSRVFAFGIHVSVGDWLMSLGALALVGSVYLIGKWRKIYDNIDGEE